MGHPASLEWGTRWVVVVEIAYPGHPPSPALTLRLRLGQAKPGYDCPVLRAGGLRVWGHACRQLPSCASLYFDLARDLCNPQR
jgi:hypothetical protein